MKLKALPLPPLILLLSIGTAILFNAIAPIARIIQFPYTLAGLPLILIGILLFRKTVALITSQRTALDPKGTPSTLITTGPFAATRNPIYLGFLSIALGVAIALGSVSALVAPIAFFAVVNAVTIPFEEHMLKHTQGMAYDSYRHRVRRWL
jgi:protein-S-isoprenylcysteine O-methyltransferase Ste14